ncbi:trehalose-phosphatase [Cellulomonas sp. RIT-PI-Y]|uniref:trehalose-phosphatase n=1 Tax=Cellulomonas sp. RIT-PI-Y TaxID=3035297 RepID=UPI0021D7D938|nr:trehalose-phosphatase [Cellulomonas sp. RIT-PI-Y]
MSELLAAALDRIAERPPLLIALDFDGTLAPLQDDPEQSRMSDDAAQALAALAARPEQVRVALVSGRALGDLHRLAHPPVGAVLIGSHGAERAQVAPHGLDRQDIRLDEGQADRLSELGSRMQAVARGRDGVWVETKPAAVVVHTRLAEERVRAEAEPEALAIGHELGSAVLHGKNVVEVSVLTADKGSAVTALRDELGARAVLYAGDDVTDEHAFEVLTADDLGVKVGDGDTVAAYRVADTEAMSDVLVALAERVAGIG